MNQENAPQALLARRTAAEVVAPSVLVPTAETFAGVPAPPQTSWAQRFASSFTKYLIKARSTRWMAWDAGVAFAALTLGHALSPKSLMTIPPLEGLMGCAVLALGAGHIAGLYERHLLLSGARIMASSVVAAVLYVVSLVLFFNIVVYQPIGRWILIITGVVFLLGILSLRLLVHQLGKTYRVRVLIVGHNDNQNAVVKLLNQGDRYHALVGFCHEDDDNRCPSFLGNIREIPDICAKHDIDEVLVAEEYLNESTILERCYEAVKNGVTMVDECTFFEESFEQVPVERIRGAWFFSSKIGQHRPIDSVLKRLMDIFLASLGLLLASPILLLLWVAVKITSPGPVLYTQIRCGRFGHPFKIYKIRSMRMDAEVDGAKWASKKDPRVTPIGRMLRKTRLDEVPQFWNVIKGDMSFVGPRPERPEHIDTIEKEVPYFSYRHWMRPGITGLAQVRYPYGASIDDAKAKLQHDLYYVKNFNILLDLQIILRTISAIMKGAR